MNDTVRQISHRIWVLWAATPPPAAWATIALYLSLFFGDIAHQLVGQLIVDNKTLARLVYTAGFTLTWWILCTRVLHRWWPRCWKLAGGMAVACFDDVAYAIAGTLFNGVGLFLWWSALRDCHGHMRAVLPAQMPGWRPDEGQHWPVTLDQLRLGVFGATIGTLVFAGARLKGVHGPIDGPEVQDALAWLLGGFYGAHLIVWIWLGGTSAESLGRHHNARA